MPGVRSSPRCTVRRMSPRGSIGGAGAVLCVALLALAAALASGCGGDSTSAGEAKVVSAAELQDFASSAGFPVYWLGERPGTEIELTEEESGQVYVRYLEPGTEPGEARAASLTVGT